MRTFGKVFVYGFGSILLALTARAEVEHVDNAGLQRLIADGVTLVDVRTPGEWRHTGIVEGSETLTFFDENGRYDAAAWVAELNRIVGPDRPLALICATGARSRAVSQFLDGQVGYSRVYNVQDGIRAWINGGERTVAPPE